jgi:hypothetical protein
MFAATRGGNNPFNPLTNLYLGTVGGTTTGTLVSLTSLSLQQNDLVIVLTGWNADSGTPGPITSGYTQAAAITNVVSGDQDVKIYVGYKFMGSTPDTSVSLTACPPSTLGTNTFVYAWRDINTASPMAATPTTATGTGASPNSPSISFSESAIVLSVAIIADGTDYITAAPSGMVNFVQQLVTPPTYRCSIAVAATYASSSYDPAAFTSTAGSTAPWCAATLALAL